LAKSTKEVYDKLVRNDTLEVSYWFESEPRHNLAETPPLHLIILMER